MIIELREWSYCPIIDELLRYYIHRGGLEEQSPARNNYIARRYVERTKNHLEEIITKANVKLRSCDFEFEQRLTHREKNEFVKRFETFITEVVRVIRFVFVL